jgi:peptidoglycan hydrolase FlgJ
MNLKIDPRSAFPGDTLQSDATAKKTKELQKLRHSCREFEAIYVNEMYKSMRKTVPESGLFDKKGMAEDVYRDMLDMEMARQTAKGDGMGIGKAMYEQLHKLHYSKDE